MIASFIAWCSWLSVTHAAPIYLREHGKRMLRGALFNDTNFLQSVNVMDYSLLVGVDDQSNELVLGIVGEHLDRVGQGGMLTRAGQTIFVPSPGTSG